MIIPKINKDTTMITNENNDNTIHSFFLYGMMMTTPTTNGAKNETIASKQVLNNKLKNSVSIYLTFHIINRFLLL